MISHINSIKKAVLKKTSKGVGQMEEKRAALLPVNHYGVVQKLCETSGFEEKRHIQHHVAVP